MVSDLISYIAVHGGAGVHSEIHEKEIKRALRRACIAGFGKPEVSASTPSVAVGIEPVREAHESSSLVNASEIMGDIKSNRSRSLDMVERAIVILEDEEHFNAGYGSNLTFDGTVECDAAITSAQGPHFGGVGAISGVKNPITVAKAILEYSLVPSTLHRIPPLMLVSSGAHKFAADRGIETVPPEQLVTPKARAQWKKWKERLEHFELPEVAFIREQVSPEHGTSNILPPKEKDQDEKENVMQDTVGAVALHPVDGFTAGVSSGGLLLKHPGRIGEAAVFGAGCWTNQRGTQSTLEGMACSVSGAGEYIIRHSLARKIGDAFNASADKDMHAILYGVLLEFWESGQELGEDSPSVGFILLTSDPDSSVRLWCAFTTVSMAVGYATSRDEKPKVSPTFDGRMENAAWNDGPATEEHFHVM